MGYARAAFVKSGDRNRISAVSLFRTANDEMNAFVAREVTRVWYEEVAWRCPICGNYSDVALGSPANGTGGARSFATGADRAF